MAFCEFCQLDQVIKSAYVIPFFEVYLFIIIKIDVNQITAEFFFSFCRSFSSVLFRRVYKAVGLGRRAGLVGKPGMRFVGCKLSFW